VIVISRGSHHRNWPLEGEGLYAHAYDPNDPEGVPNQTQNFMRYAVALRLEGPYAIVAPPVPDDPAEAAHILCEMCDFRQIVETALNTKVHVQ
jgi:hypothetical protein